MLCVSRIQFKKAQFTNAPRRILFFAARYPREDGQTCFRSACGGFEHQFFQSGMHPFQLIGLQHCAKFDRAVGLNFNRATGAGLTVRNRGLGTDADRVDLQRVEAFFPDEEADPRGSIGIEFVDNNDDFTEETHESGTDHDCPNGHKRNKKHAQEQRLAQAHRPTVHLGIAIFYSRSREPRRKGTDQVGVKTGDRDQHENRNDPVPEQCDARRNEKTSERT